MPFEQLFYTSINIILSFILGVQGVQRFEQQPSYTEVNPGQDALLVCKVFNKRGTCSWQKDNKVNKGYSYESLLLFLVQNVSSKS